MARMTAVQKSQLNLMNEASRKAGGIGTRIDNLEYGDVAVPAVGTVAVAPIIKYTTAPALGTATKVLAATLLTTGVQTITTGITDPDVPRLVSVKGGDANVTGNVVVVGLDINDDAATDTIALSGTSEVAGDVAFKTVTSIQLPVYAVAGTETVSVGFTDKIGFPIAIPNTGLVLAKNFNGSADAGTVTAGATAQASVYAPAGTLDGAKLVDLYFLAA